MSGMDPDATMGPPRAGVGGEPWAESVPGHWCAGDVFETRMLEAMSLIAPEVERFVISAVIKYTRGPGGEKSAPEAIAFIHQEAEHSRVHKRFNQRLAKQGIDVAKVLAPVRIAADFARRWLPTGDQLAIAAACEHLSALLSLSFLRASRRAEIRPASVLRLFEQHACDEIGHRSIVFDLLKIAGYGWLARGSALVLVSVAALVCVPLVVHALLKSDASSSVTAIAQGVASWVRVKRWISPAMFARGWLAYLAPHFHPRHLPNA